ncbi:hypothetical protein HaLaN_21241 [Haematococcus lacustris]|uniref:Uncharacterized protein n=1 Tax=Haematococcus lacustris TaxID=44745 RepID=A0A699ZXY4_HAELA|nr:hypothetical protein HaLaN_21241 [Haematococcus lacustris]
MTPATSTASTGSPKCAACSALHCSLCLLTCLAVRLVRPRQPCPCLGLCPWWAGWAQLPVQPWCARLALECWAQAQRLLAVGLSGCMWAAGMMRGATTWHHIRPLDWLAPAGPAIALAIYGGLLGSHATQPRASLHTHWLAHRRLHQRPHWQSLAQVLHLWVSGCTAPGDTHAIPVLVCMSVGHPHMRDSTQHPGHPP